MKKTGLFILCVFLLFGLCIGFMYGHSDTFTGERIADSTCYSLRFSSMNQEDTHTMSLSAGEQLSVDYSIDRGRVDLTIVDENGKTVYRGNDLSSGSFLLEVPGSCRIDVKARHASGFLTIQIAGNEDKHQ